MEIQVIPREGRHELLLTGRLDANWAEHVGQAIETAIRSGHHQLDLDFAQVNYVSSAGIRVLIKYYKQLKAARGLLRVLRPTESVLSVLQLSGIATLLVAAALQDAAAPAPEEPAAAAPKAFERDGVAFESHELAREGRFEGHWHGDPAAFATGGLQSNQATGLRCESDVLAIGLGAFGRSAADAAGRHGESLAVAGTAVTLPTDGSSVPDYQVTEERLVPELQLLYGLAARGKFARLLRFEAGRSPRGVLSLAGLVEAALAQTNGSAAAFAILAESASIVGATLQRPPDQAAGQSPLAFPGVRDWLSFTTERTDERNLVLITGVADPAPTADDAPGLRPIGPGTAAHGHFHAAVFPYRPLPKGRLDLAESVTQLLGTESALSVVHLLADEREFEGVGQTDLMRGACWVAPLRLLGRAPRP
jgi:anti-anti-sigma factor